MVCWFARRVARGRVWGVVEGAGDCPGALWRLGVLFCVGVGEVGAGIWAWIGAAAERSARERVAAMGLIPLRVFGDFNLDVSLGAWGPTPPFALQRMGHPRFLLLRDEEAWGPTPPFASQRMDHPGFSLLRDEGAWGPTSPFALQRMGHPGFSVL